jgi:4-hydroxybenzoate polyprenyltransferase
MINSVILSYWKNVFQVLWGYFTMFYVYGFVNPFDLIHSLIFSTIYSLVYLINDIVDYKEDQKKPEKLAKSTYHRFRNKCVYLAITLIIIGIVYFTLKNLLWIFLMILVAIYFHNFLKIKEVSMPLFECSKFFFGMFIYSFSFGVDIPLWIWLFGVLISVGYTIIYKYFYKKYVKEKEWMIYIIALLGVALFLVFKELLFLLFSTYVAILYIGMKLYGVEKIRTMNIDNRGVLLGSLIAPFVPIIFLILLRFL